MLDRGPLSRQVLAVGLIGGVACLYVSLVGLVGTFSERDIIGGVISLGQTLLLLVGLITGYIASRRPGAAPKSRVGPLLSAALAGGLAGGALSLLVALGASLSLRDVFLNASPALYSLLTFDQGTNGAWIPLAGGALLGLLGGGMSELPGRWRRPLLWALASVLALGLFSTIARVTLTALGGLPRAVARFLFASGEGLTIPGAVISFVLFSGGAILWASRGTEIRSSVERLPTRRRKVLRIGLFSLVVIAALALPSVLGPFISQVIVLVGLYALMGLGLNITLGFAGLFDLGFVAFFAVGAYTTGLITAYGEQGILHWPFWVALPISTLAALIVGMALGMPVLGIRGDYLAIATLGFGEIARLLVGSDFLAPWLGGSQGIIGIQKPCIGGLGPFLGPGIPQECFGIELGGPGSIYFIVVACAVIVAMVAIRLRDSRLGRAWMAVREDEDVAEALGVNLVQTKLLAYGLGAAFAGLSGSIFAALVGSIFDSSMQLLVSINVVALIIVGGMGSIPGVIVGAAVLIGLPELFREFSEFRLLFYGAVLIAMMRVKPEGLWPSKAIVRELHTGEPV